MSRSALTRLITFVGASIVFSSIILFPTQNVYASSNATCKSLKAKYPFGIAISFATRGTTKAFISKSLYLRYQTLDRDFDGVVCELTALEQATSSVSATSSSTTTTTVPTCANGGPCKVGDTGPGGGIIFLDTKARNSWGRYLEVAPVTAWWNSRDPLGTFGCNGQWVDDGVHLIANNTYEQVGTGRDNTIAIMASCKESNTAARLATNLVSGGKQDWFIPSRNEQFALAAVKELVPGLQDGLYLSSTEADMERAYVFNYSTGLGYLVWKYAGYLVRPIRYVQCLTGCTK